MNIQVINPKEDQFENKKENIFLAFDDHNNYLGHAYVVQSSNHHQIFDISHLLYFDVEVLNDMDADLTNHTRQILYDHILKRALEIRDEKPTVKARFYTGVIDNLEKLTFYYNNGLDASYSLIMDMKLLKNTLTPLSRDVCVVDIKIDFDEDINAYKALYDEIFITPLYLDQLQKQSKNPFFQCAYVLVNHIKIGAFTIFEKDGFGYIESVFVLPEFRGQGMAKCIMNYIFRYFQSKGLEDSRLEVWDLNKSSIQLYKSLGYKEVMKHIAFPGIML